MQEALASPNFEWNKKQTLYPPHLSHDGGKTFSRYRLHAVFAWQGYLFEIERMAHEFGETTR